MRLKLIRFGGRLKFRHRAALPHLATHVWRTIPKLLIALKVHVPWNATVHCMETRRERLQYCPRRAGVMRTDVAVYVEARCAVVRKKLRR